MILFPVCQREFFFLLSIVINFCHVDLILPFDDHLSTDGLSCYHLRFWLLLNSWPKNEDQTANNL